MCINLGFRNSLASEVELSYRFDGQSVKCRVSFYVIG